MMHGLSSGLPSQAQPQGMMGGLPNTPRTDTSVPQDTVPAMLSPGEGVLNHGAMQQVGPGFVDFLNRLGQQGGQPLHFAQGGVVPDPYGVNQPAVNVGGMGPITMPSNPDAMPPAQNPTPTTGQAPQGNTGATDRLQSYFGNLGVQSTGLQNQATGAMSRFLQQQNPAQNAMNQANPFLTGLLGNQPGTGLDPNAQSRLNQGMSQNGIPGQVGGYYNNLLGGNAGPGSDVEQTLSRLMQTGGATAGQGGLQDALSASLQRLMSGGGAGVGTQGLDILARLAGSNPGQGVVDALQPTFEKNLALADQTGGRFGSANAMMRSQALNDYNLMAANALQQGVNQQSQAAQALGQLSQAGGIAGLQAQLQAGGLGNSLLGTLGSLANQQAGIQTGAANQLGSLRQQGLGLQNQGAGTYGALGLQNQGQQMNAAQILGQLGLGGQQNANQGTATQVAGVNALGNLGQGASQQGLASILGAYGMGSGQAQQNDVQTQRTLQILMSLLGSSQGASMGQPNIVQPSGWDQFMGVLGAGSQLGGAALGSR